MRSDNLNFIRIQERNNSNLFLTDKLMRFHSIYFELRYLRCFDLKYHSNNTCFLFIIYIMSNFSLSSIFVNNI